MAEVIYLQTTNPQKLAEYRKILGRHRIDVIQASPDEDPLALLNLETKNKIRAVMREESNLFDPETGEKLDSKNLPDLKVARNITTLQCHIKRKKDEIIEKKYEENVDGFIIPNDEVENGDLPVFGWDNRFVSKGSGLSYHEMRKRGVKLSGRDRVLSKFTKEHVTFEKRRDLAAFPQKPHRTVDFKRRPIDFAKENPYMNNSHIEMYGVRNMINSGLNLGPFFRSASNRRESIYWCPGGNGGLPYTPKIDKESKEPNGPHETKYLVHDIKHHVLMPDLIFEGATDDLSIRFQTICRMMSEALTLVGADMLFADTMKRSGTEYDYTKQKIYPLFESLKGDFANDKSALKSLYYANVRYALRGDDTNYQSMGAHKEALESYKGKYNAYFVEDFKWTEQNIKNMCENADVFKQWRKSVEPLSELKKYMKGCITVSEAMEEVQKISQKNLAECSNDELVDLIYEWAWQTMISPNLENNKIEPDDDHALKSGFLKYMSAQLFIFDNFDFIPESNLYREKIIKYLQKHIDTLTQEDVDIVRNFYSQFVDILFERAAITEEDRSIYKEVFPLFPPFFINYDLDQESYPHIREVSSQILKD